MSSPEPTPADSDSDDSVDEVPPASPAYSTPPPEGLSAGEDG